MKRLFFGIGIFSAFLLGNGASAATITCNFMSETTISKSGEWLRTDDDYMKIFDMFGDGLVLPLENSLLGKLDSGEVFLAGYVRRGRVYLKGDDMGVNGKLIEVINNEITIYDGMCNISFGWFFIDNLEISR